MKRAASLGLTIALAAGCSGGNAASELAQAPDYQPEGQTKCGVRKSPTKPLIVEWPSAERVALEARAFRGAVAVRYNGCEMELLTRCKVPGAYVYTPTSRQHDRVSIRDADELYANVPLGAAKLEGALEKAGELNVEMTIVGRYESDVPVVARSQLRGDCAPATHVIMGFTAGAFEFFAGASASVGGSVGVGDIGAGAKSSAKRETLNMAGDSAACKASSRNDKQPPDGCGALLRVEVVPLASEEALASAAAPLAPPAAPPPPGAAASVAAAGARPSGMVRLTGGTFTNYRDKKVKVTPFELDVTEVTVAAYDACVQAGKCKARTTHPRYDRRSTKKPESRSCNAGASRRRKGSASHPMNCVIRDEAIAYCRFMKKRLPTSNEWQWAARAGKDRKYPWGNDPPRADLLNGCGTECSAKRKLYRDDDGFAMTAPVGSFPATDLGLYDMAGNVSEWTEDAGTQVQHYWGGNWGIAYNDEVMRSWWINPELKKKGISGLARAGAHVGFRCARTRR